MVAGVRDSEQRTIANNNARRSRRFGRGDHTRGRGHVRGGTSVEVPLIVAVLRLLLLQRHGVEGLD
jgi:hypothetical protein